MRFLLYLSIVTFSIASLPLLPTTIRAESTPAEQDERALSDAMYRDAQLSLGRQDYAKTIVSLEKYLEFTRTHLHRPERVFWAINQVGQIYLGVKRDPDSGIRRFPHSEVARRAFDLLRRETSAAFHPGPVPADLVDLLGDYEELARASTPPE